MRNCSLEQAKAEPYRFPKCAPKPLPALGFDKQRRSGYARPFIVRAAQDGSIGRRQPGHSLGSGFNSSERGEWQPHTRKTDRSVYDQQGNGHRGLERSRPRRGSIRHAEAPPIVIFEVVKVCEALALHMDAGLNCGEKSRWFEIESHYHCHSSGSAI
jgi:hypothetical protein